MQERNKTRDKKIQGVYSDYDDTLQFTFFANLDLSFSKTPIFRTQNINAESKMELCVIFAIHIKTKSH